jgi:hypothetical protein
MVYAKKQRLDRKRSAETISFLPAVCSSLGEFSPGMFTLQELLVKILAFKLAMEREASGPRGDGYTSAQLTAKFRTSFKAAVQVAVARGLARQLIFAGLPHGGA